MIMPSDFGVTLKLVKIQSNRNISTQIVTSPKSGASGLCKSFIIYMFFLMLSFFNIFRSLVCTIYTFLRGQLKHAGCGNFLAALNTLWWPSAVICSLFGLLSFWHIPHFHFQFNYATMMVFRHISYIAPAKREEENMLMIIKVKLNIHLYTPRVLSYSNYLLKAIFRVTFLLIMSWYRYIFITSNYRS